MAKELLLLLLMKKNSKMNFNNKINSIKANVTDLKKYLTLSLKNNSNISIPEIIKNKDYDYKSDIWNLGIIIYYLF